MIFLCGRGFLSLLLGATRVFAIVSPISFSSFALPLPISNCLKISERLFFSKLNASLARQEPPPHGNFVVYVEVKQAQNGDSEVTDMTRPRCLLAPRRRADK